MVKNPAHKIDKVYEVWKSHSVEWTDPANIKNFTSLQGRQTPLVLAI